MYRAVALAATRQGLPLDDSEALTRVAESVKIELTGLGRGPVLLDGEDVSDAIRAPEVTRAASVMSTVPGVRRAMVREQRRIGHSASCVMEGRDIGTVVFPDADLKLFLIATLEERARRRLADLEALGRPAAADAVRAEIAERDRRDSTREDSPLRRADDAVELDTTGLSIEEQVAAVIRLAMERGAALHDERKTG
jgi:cytidylate kinase